MRTFFLHWEAIHDGKHYKGHAIKEFNDYSVESVFNRMLKRITSEHDLAEEKIVAINFNVIGDI